MKKKSNFTKPKDVETFIRIWGWMDDIVTHICGKNPIAYWRENSLPRDRHGMSFIVIGENGKPRPLAYRDIVTNRYLFESMYNEDKRNYDRLYSVFTRTLNMVMSGSLSPLTIRGGK